MPRQKKPPAISQDAAGELIQEQVRRFVLRTEKPSHARGAAVRILMNHGFTQDNARVFFNSMAKEYRRSINPEFGYNIHSLWFVGNDDSVWVSNRARTGYIDITGETFSKARRLAFEQWQNGRRQNKFGSVASRKYICANCDHEMQFRTNHNAPFYSECPSCSWKGLFGHFSLWPNKDRPFICLE